MVYTLILWYNKVEIKHIRKGVIFLRTDLGWTLYLARQKKGINQTDLAEIMGVWQKDISRWEQGHHVPKLETLAKLAKVLEIPQKEIMGRVR